MLFVVPKSRQTGGSPGGSVRSLDLRREMVPVMKRTTGGFAVYLLLAGLLVVGVAIYLQNGIAVLVGIGLMLVAVTIYLIQKRGQRRGHDIYPENNPDT
jgi:type IV secretory pathway TrbD component